MRNLCTVEDCKAVVIGNGLCKKHYHRMRRTGTTDLIDRRTFCECGRPTVGGGLCELHYRRRRRATQQEIALKVKQGMERPCQWCAEQIPVERHLNAWYCDPICKMHASNAKKERDAARLRAYHYNRKFGITVEDYDRMAAEQNGGCAICGTTEPGGRGVFHVDHCHDSGKVRGLLCTGCNTGLGQFKDDPTRLLAAVEYLAAG